MFPRVQLELRAAYPVPGAVRAVVADQETLRDLDRIRERAAGVAEGLQEMLNLMEELNLEIAGDFLVMAATLVYIKSKLLLPVDQERIEQGLEEDPRKNLVQALLEQGSAWA